MDLLRSEAFGTQERHDEIDAEGDGDSEAEKGFKHLRFPQSRSSARAYNASTRSVPEPSAIKMRSDMSGSPVDAQTGLRALRVRLRLGRRVGEIKKR
jgi:hypothetical protein